MSRSSNALKHNDVEFSEVEKGKLRALDENYAVIEFSPDGTIESANENFQKALGYSLTQIVGKHHKMFCTESTVNDLAYKKFWNDLADGLAQIGEFKRVRNGGETIWITASYTPIKDENGKVFKVVKFAQDITENKLKNFDFEGKMNAVSKAQAVIEFNLDGTIITANENFLVTVGYSLEEIQGKHHSMFAEPEYAKSEEYKSFWEKLNRGEFDTGEYKRLGNGGKEIWINASYNPIFDADGKPFKVVKFATNVTEQKIQFADFEGKINAISKSQAVIEFNLDGTIITANDNFLATVGYRLDEIQGRHHSMFAEPEYAASMDYKNFWQKLNRGEFDTGEYKRLGNGGKEVWINASYNPIMDAEGKPFKVVKYATNITEEKKRNADFEGQLNAIDKSQAVIEFNLDGTIITANENFLATLGYRLDEIQGRHHRMFAEPEYADSMEYREFWQKLNKGEFDSGQYKRVGNGGKEIYIQASYNPIRDVDGNVYKVVKYATDLTQEKVAYNNLVESFDKASEELLSNSETLSSTASIMSEASKGTLSQSTAAAASAEQVNQGVATVGSSTEEMTASIKEIANSAANSSKISQRAKEKSESANTTISELGSASEEIGNVIKVISSIAQQTNLLALNATIEAARAGEAGKGFAVVANEVKELAKQTANATDDISSKITNVQNSTVLAVEAIQDIGSIIEELNEIASSTAAAVEEQAATTNEVSRIVAESASGVESIASIIQDVAKSAEDGTSNADKTLESARCLNELSKDLKMLVEQSKAS